MMRVDRGGDVGDAVGAALVGLAEPVQRDLRDAEAGQRLAALAGPSLAQRRRVDAVGAGVRRLAVGHGDDDDLAPLAGRPAHQAAGGEHLVVGVRRDDDEAAVEQGRAGPPHDDHQSSDGWTCTTAAS